MTWNDSPPTKEELKSLKKESWDVMPPSTKELETFNNEKPSELESAARGAAQGASFGFAPSIVGAASAIPTVLDVASGSRSLKDILDKYNKSREESKAKFKKAEETNPKSYFSGSLIGALAPAALTGGIGEEAALAQGASKVLPISAKTAAGALTGATYGGLAGAGEGVSAGQDLTGTAKDIASGVAGGAVLGSIGSQVANKLENLPESLKKSSAERALKATGISKGQIKNLLKQEVAKNAYASSAGKEAPESLVQQMGSNLLEQNPYTETPIVTAGATPEDILERTQQLSQKSGEDIGKVLKQFDQEQNNPEISDKFFNPKNASKEVESQLLNPLEVNGEIPPVAVPAAKQIQNVLDTINKYGNEPIPFQKAQELKGLLTQLANYDVDGSISNQILKRAGGIVNKQIEDAADQVANSSNKPDLLDRYLKAKDLYKTAQTAQNAALGKTAGNMVNRDLSPSDYAAGAIGTLAHGVDTGSLAAIGNKISRTYGNSTLAQVGNATSNALSKMSSTLVDAPKQSIMNLGQQLITSGGELENSLGKVLVKAADRDDIGRNALIFSLMQNPSYRELLRKITGSEEPNQ